MELLDVLNKKGEVIGVKSRKEIMKNGDLHRTVHIWIINEFNEILLQKRNPKKDTYPNLWAISTAGHVITNETSKEAAIRELKEELNLNIKEEELEYLFTIERKQEFKDMKIHCFDDVYLLKYNLNIEKTKLQKSELTDLIFINYKELQEIYKNNDPKFVPATEEHDKLFKYLEKKLQDSDLVFKTKIIHTYEECLKACAFTLRHEIIITSLLFLASIVGLFGIFKNIKIFYYAIIFIMLLLTFINAKAKKKTKQVFEQIKYVETDEELYFYDTYFMSSNHLNSHIKYKHIYKVCETKNNFYIYLNNNIYFNIKKYNLKEDNILFLRNLK
jgi:isopentenyldiphosphate isomerase